MFSAGLFERLGALIPFDGAFLATVDPATLLYTRAFRSGMPLEASPAFVRCELGDDDVNQLRQLVLTPTPIGWLDEATHGDRAAARRYREAMAPFGLGDELRVALMTEGTCWGLLCLHLAAGPARVRCSRGRASDRPGAARREGAATGLDQRTCDGSASD